MNADFCVDPLKEALAKHGTPETFNPDQGSQFTSGGWIDVLSDAKLNHHQLKLVGLKKWWIGNPPFQHEHAPHARLNLINRLENGGFKPHHGK